MTSSCDIEREIVDLYSQGLSCRQIGKRLGWNDETIRKKLVSANVPRRARNHKKPRPVPTWEAYFAGRFTDSGDCKLWKGNPDQGGYGRCTAAFAPDIHFAHRMSYFLHHGAFDLKLRVLHRCDTPACINPHHLFLGTQTDNVADMVAKCRHRSGAGYLGEENPGARLTGEGVVQMRELRRQTKMPFYKLAERFGVSTMTAHRACSGESWGHIEQAEGKAKK